MSSRSTVLPRTAQPLRAEPTDRTRGPSSLTFVGRFAVTLMGLGVLVGFSGDALAESSLAECADGVDNDGDGDIDLNDSGCGCSSTVDLFSSISSYISNESFEDYSSCPTSYSQLYYCDDWQQATGATSDYFACGYETSSTSAVAFGSFPTPPDGTAFAGSITFNASSRAYVEYIGGCTTEPLVAGTEYTFEMYIAASTGGSYGGNTSGEIQLFGIPSCATIPIGGYASIEGSYDLIDEVTVSLSGGSAFQLITFTFTPTTDYDAIIWGGADDMTIESGKSSNYLLYDALTLNATTSFGDEITSTGDCYTGYTLSGPVPTGVDFQWYLDGEAIPGATSSTYAVPSGDDGTYTLRVDDGTDCNLTSNEVIIDCDADDDGYDVTSDCDDADATVYPGATEYCDGVDNDCDGTVDEDDAADASTWYADTDSDGYGDPGSSTQACSQPSGYVADDSDCDDGVTTVNPSATEYCDGVDNDCDGTVDEDAAADASTWYADGDGDGYGDSASSTQACSQPSGYVADDTDCDDGEVSTNPGATEYCDGVDNDCDGTVDEDDAADASTWYADTDGDGYGRSSLFTDACSQPSGYVADATDCDDGEVTTNPGATEYCDGVDNDCDGTVDEDSAADASTWYADTDGDSYGDPASSTAACSQPSGYVADSSDCDPTVATTNPGATEYCDGVDNDCDGTVDEDSAADASTWYADTDGDGYGDPGSSTQACSQPSGYVADGSDCDPTVATTNPGATEYCDGVDNDCDGTVDEDDAADASTWYADIDGDGYGRSSLFTDACGQPSGYVADATDCDDSDGAVNPAATEVCDGIDNDCDGTVDEDSAAGASTWYADTDGDGFGDPASTTAACSEPSGYVADSSDCDDGDGAVNTDATEVCDGIDNDCDGAVDEDASTDVLTWYADNDGDGFGDPLTTDIDCAEPTGFVADDTDCDDTDPAVNPDAAERCDGIDNDCDGTVDEDDSDDALTWYADTDGDGYGDPADSTEACAEPSGYVADDTDCDDTDGAVNPAAIEACDGIDNDCDGTVDEDDAVDALTWYADTDGDGFGDPGSSTMACSEPSGYVADATDCDDGEATTNPDAEETWYDGVDSDCDGWSDYDSDFDGYDSLDEAEHGEDCDDTDADINPDAEEIWYDGVDQDCDEWSDYDADGDGFDSATYGGDDCDDADDLTYPGAPDDPYDGVINDCDDADEYDADGDGHDAVEHGGDDCDDANSDINPGADEIWYDGVDDDCDGNDDDHDYDGFPVDEDCDDTDAGSNPDADEIWYDGVDQDCDGNDDDQDEDGWPVETDCDDTDAEAYPGAGGYDDECNPIDTGDTDAGPSDSGGYKWEGGGGCESCSAAGTGAAAGLAMLPMLLGFVGLRRRRNDRSDRA